MSFRYAHSEGHTDLCYTSDSKYIITCGSEGDVRIWEGVNDADQRDVCVGETAWAIAQKGNNVYVGTDTNTVQAYTFPELETDGLITRFTAPVTQIDLSPNGKKLVAGSCDMEIHVVDIDSMECKKLIGHKAPVLSVSFDPKLEFIASSSCDGTVQVWSLSSYSVIQKWDCVEKSNSFETASSLCRIHFNKTGTLLAIPHKSHIKLYQRSSWNQAQALSTPENEVFSVCRFSPCGKYLAGGTVNGSLVVWVIATEKIVNKISDSNHYAITAIAWNSDSSMLAFCNASGQLADLQISLKPETTSVEDPSGVPLAVPEFDDDDDDNENVISIEKIKAQNSFSQLNEDSSDLPLGITAPSEGDADDKESIPESYMRGRGVALPISQLQPAFQPSSTPVHLLQRFMVWNSVGIVRQFNTEETNEIDIEFHDVSVHHGFRMNNMHAHTMASLSSRALILASPRTDDTESKVVCILMKAWDGQKEWDYSLEKEDVSGVLAGENWVALATDTNMLRIFTIDGTQTDLYSIPGPLVSLAGYKNNIAVVFHSGLGCNGEQFLSFNLLKVDPESKRISCSLQQELAVSPQTTLRWIGFTDEGSLATVDSQGVLRIIYGKMWRPVSQLDEHCKSKFDHYFVIGVSELNQNVRCILCKGAYYPPVLPKPIVTEIKWQIPLCDLSSDKGKLEEEMLRNLITLPKIEFNEDLEQEKIAIEKCISIAVMKLFALACRSGLEGRAISLCESMQSAEVVKLASKYAAKQGRHNLAQRILHILNRIPPVHHTERSVEESESGEREGSPEKSKNEDYSQDLFEDSRPVKENFILKHQKKKAVSPKPIRIQRRNDNPFKKSNPSLDPATNDNNSDNNEAPERKINFMEWFAKNRLGLQIEFPLLREEELILAGMNKYKQNVGTKIPFRSQSDIVEGTPVEEVESKKRKTSPDLSDSARLQQPPKKLNTSSKLKSFSFNKK